MLSVNISRVVALYLRKHGIPGRPGTHIRLEVSEDFPAVALKPGDDPCYVFCQNVSPSGWMISAQEMQA